jgi:hypothetical protein
MVMALSGQLCAWADVATAAASTTAVSKGFMVVSDIFIRLSSSLG